MTRKGILKRAFSLVVSHLLTPLATHPGPPPSTLFVPRRLISLIAADEKKGTMQGINFAVDASDGIRPVPNRLREDLVGHGVLLGTFEVDYHVVSMTCL